MSNIHYFQRYSQKENMVTNNTMLLFSRLYHHDTNQFNTFIKTLFEESEHFLNHHDFDMTINFMQQKRGEGSIPDAFIKQQSFKIVIETKLYGQENLQQLKKHCESFSNEDWQILLLIDKKEISVSFNEKMITLLNEINKDRNPKINFVSTTFKEIIHCFRTVLNEFDREMYDIIDDYEAFCLETRLVDNSETKMRAVSVGTTLKQNLKYNLYYMPRENYQAHKYLALYNKKAVHALGEIVCIADVTYDESSEQLVVDNVLLGELTEKQINDVKQVVIGTKKRFGFCIGSGHRFFFVEEFVETSFRKVSKHGLLSRKYFDLANIQGYSAEMNLKEVAHALVNETWE